ncbi:MAG: glycine cleavage system protein GcvH [Deinococcales bacterium]
MNIPSSLRYLKTHEYLRLEGDIATVGITDFAQDQLGDVVYVELPEVGRVVSSGEAVAVVESVKTASDIYSPASGEVIEVNKTLSDEPEHVNSDPYGAGFLFKIRVQAVSSELLDAAAYRAIAEAEA